MHLNQLRTVELIEVQQRIEVDVQGSTVRGSAGPGEGEEVDRHAEVLTDHDRNVLGELAFVLSRGSLSTLPSLSRWSRVHHRPRSTSSCSRASGALGWVIAGAHHLLVEPSAWFPCGRPRSLGC